MIEGEILARTAILAAELVAQEHVETGEGGLGRGLHEGLERNHAGKLHLQARAAHRAIVLGDNVHPLEKDRLDGVLPRPQRQRVVAERTKIRIEDEGGKAGGGQDHGAPSLLSLRTAAVATVYRGA